MQPREWYGELAARVSRGAVTAKASNLGGLHAARQAHQGQFWTPAPIARFMWRIVEQVFAARLATADGVLTVLENSIGSGRLLQFADPARVVVRGCDPDRETLQALSQRMTAAGFDVELLDCGLEEIRADGFDVAPRLSGLVGVDTDDAARAADVVPRRDADLGVGRTMRRHVERCRRHRIAFDRGDRVRDVDRLVAVVAELLRAFSRRELIGLGELAGAHRQV